MTTSTDCDVIVMGAGPAGCTAATFLARQRQRVIVLEKDEFPRFQIGESLLPVCLPVLERLGIEPNVETHVFKRGAEFVAEDIGASRVFDFSKALPGAPRHAWQVDRTGFDLRLRDRARDAGAEVRHGVCVERTQITAHGVRVRSNQGELTARFLVDATGQGRLLARQHGSAQPYPGFGHSAAFTHFENISAAVFDELAPHYDIRIMIDPLGWGWIIPLPHRRLSVGLVTRRSGVARDLEQYIERSPLIQRWTRGATRRAGKVVRNFSYKNAKPYGERFVCVGDAACFLDPVFSSGVSLAVVSAARMTELLTPALDDGREGQPELMAPLDESMRLGYATFSAIIDRFYHTHFIKHFIFGTTRDEAMSQGVVSVLAGDVWRSDNRFQQMLLNSRRRPRHHDAPTAVAETPDAAREAQPTA